MKNWTIKKRITVGFAVVLGLVAAQSAATFYLLKAVSRQTQSIATDSLPGTILAAKLRDSVSIAQIDTLRALLARTPEARKPFEEAIAARRETNDGLLADYEKTINHEEDRELFARVKDSLSKYRSARAEMFALADAGHFAVLKRGENGVDLQVAALP